MTKYKWGFLRETTALANKAGIDKATGLHRTGLEKYLKVIFPQTNDTHIHYRYKPLKNRIKYLPINYRLG